MWQGITPNVIFQEICERRIYSRKSTMFCKENRCSLINRLTKEHWNYHLDRMLYRILPPPPFNNLVSEVLVGIRWFLFFFNSMFGNMLIFSFLHIISSFMPLNNLIKRVNHKAFQKVLEMGVVCVEKEKSCSSISHFSLQNWWWCIMSSAFFCLSHHMWRMLCAFLCPSLAGLQQHQEIPGENHPPLCSVLHLCVRKGCPHP